MPLPLEIAMSATQTETNAPDSRGEVRSMLGDNVVQQPHEHFVSGGWRWSALTTNSKIDSPNTTTRQRTEPKAIAIAD